MGMVMPILSVKEVEPVSEYLCSTLGFQQSFAIRDEATGKISTAGLMLEPTVNLMVGLADNEADAQASGKGVVIYVYPDEDLDAYYNRIKPGLGAALIEEIGDRFWGDRTFTVQTPSGHIFSFAKSVSQEVNLPEGQQMVGATA
jgi:uncharacterized glyoxalase superfamily protein PhnB